MTPQAVATAAKAAAPQTPPAQAPAASAFDFSQLLGGGFISLLQANNSNSTPPAPAPQPSQQKNTNSNSDSANANLAGAACATTAPQPATTQGTTQAATQAATQSTAQATTPAAAGSPTAPPTVALLPATPQTATNTGNAGNATGQGTQTVPGTAAVEARVAAGASTYLSQPNTMLAGLWHHVGATQAGGAAQDDDTQADDASAPNSESSTAATDPSAPQPKLATLADAAAQDAHDASDSDDSARAPDSIPGQAVATPVTTDPTAAALPAPSVGGHQAALATATAPTNAAATSLPMPVQVLPAAEQVALSLRQAAQNGIDRIEIQLKPASLGAIAVKLDVTHDGHASAVISADRSDTLNMLRQDSSGLQQALRDAGLKTDSGSLSFNLRGGDQQSFAQNAAASTTSQRYANAATTPSSSQSAQPYLRRHDGALDIEV